MKKELRELRAMQSVVNESRSPSSVWCALFTMILCYNALWWLANVPLLSPKDALFIS